MRRFALAAIFGVLIFANAGRADEPVVIADGDPFVESVCVGDAGLTFKAGQFNMGVEFFAVVRGKPLDAESLAEYEFWDLRTLPTRNSIQLLKWKDDGKGWRRGAVLKVEQVFAAHEWLNEKPLCEATGERYHTTGFRRVTKYPKILHARGDTWDATVAKELFAPRVWDDLAEGRSYVVVLSGMDAQVMRVQQCP